MNNSIKAGLIWVTGFSSSGKTTISRKLFSELKKNNEKVIFLDGDDLRGIFGNQWGYDKASRIELSKIYFRMCSHLIAQGNIVLISAIAMFDEVGVWVSENVENSIQVFLNVPPETRIERDAKTKGIFTNKKLNDDYYDIPKNANLVIDNYGSKNINDSVQEIIKAFQSQGNASADKGRSSHWQSYYSKNQAPVFPSPFAVHVNEAIEPDQLILEIGCGNGRDSFFFANEGHKVTALDRSEAAIAHCNTLNEEQKIEFLEGTMTDNETRFKDSFNIIYSRFVIHAMPLKEEIDLLNISYKALKNDGKFYIECRSIKDQFAREGDFLSHAEKVSGHYRRFIILDELIERLKRTGFTIEDVVEDKGLAVYGDDDPVVIRVCAKKP